MVKKLIILILIFFTGLIDASSKRGVKRELSNDIDLNDIALFEYLELKLPKKLNLLKPNRFKDLENIFFLKEKAEEEIKRKDREAKAFKYENMTPEKRAILLAKKKDYRKKKLEEKIKKKKK